MSDFTVFMPEDPELLEVATEDEVSGNEASGNDPEIIEGDFSSEELEELGDDYFDAEDIYLDEQEEGGEDEEEDDDDDDDNDEEEEEDETDDEDLSEGGLVFEDLPEMVQAEIAAGGGTDASPLLSRNATMALLARIQSGLFGGESSNDHLPRRLHQRPKWRRTIQSEPEKAGLDLLRSGEFGEPSPPHTIQSCRRFPLSVRHKLLRRESSPYNCSKVKTAEHFLPRSNGRLAVQYPSRAYSGQFSQDGSFFYTCSQDFRVRLYDTTDPTRWKHYKTVVGSTGRWTITDANLSPDNRFVAYSSITPVVYMAKTAQENTEEQEILDFSGTGRMSYNNGIWSIRFSNDAREIVAGAGDCSMYIYDIETKSVVLGVKGHKDDVNAVCFADQSSNVLFSGSDDCLIKVWDRRSMVNKKEAGALPGHTEGITFISSKGDGRYVVSNGKDQTTKLWDIRMLVSAEQWEDSIASQLDLQTGFDYRHQEFPGHMAKKHSDDRSVMTYTGHAILKTLIRCGFSPLATTDQQYIYSGSDCGKVWIWNLDGTVNRTLDLSKAARISAPTQPNRRRFLGFGGGGDKACIRDAAWHPTLPYMASTSWHSEMDAGSIYLHEYGEDADLGSYETGAVLKSGIRESRERASGFWM